MTTVVRIVRSFPGAGVRGLLVQVEASKCV